MICVFGLSRQSRVDSIVFDRFQVFQHREHFVAARPGQEQHRQVRAQRAGTGGQLLTGQPRHHHVGDEQVEPVDVPFQELEHLLRSDGEDRQPAKQQPLVQALLALRIECGGDQQLHHQLPPKNANVEVPWSPC